MSTSLLHSFLRPLPLPQASFVQSILRPVSTAGTLRHPTLQPSQPIHANSPTTSQTAVPPTILQPTTTAQTSNTSIRFPTLPYYVARTASNELPVYQTAKRGGNLKQTRIRKVSGSLEALRDELRAALEVKDEHVVINQLARHVVIKGWIRMEVKRFLEDRHF